MASGFVIKYNEEFWHDLKDAVDWYDAVSRELGTKLLDQIWLAELKLETNPLAFHKVTKTDFRRILLKTFPFKIFYRIEEKNVFVIALIHSSRSNRFIKRRLK